MGGYAGKTSNHPRDVIGGQARGETESQWGEMTGTIVAFDAAKQTATIQPDYQKRLNGKPTKLPELQEVPVRFPRAGNGAMTFPVAKGDKVVLRPQMRNSEAFHTGDDYVAPDARTNSLSDMEAFLDGGEPLTSPIANFDGANVHVRFNEEGTHGIRGSEDGKIAIEGSEGNIYDLLATAIELIASDGLNILSGSSAGNGIHELQHKAELTEIAAKLRAMAL